MSDDKRTGEEGEQRVPGWVYLILLVFLVVVLLGVESVLNWLLPAR
ncbi:MAG: hypothetical protein ACOY94_27080 [Bacillota bacterium]